MSTPRVCHTVGDLRAALDGYPDDIPLDIYLNGEDRLSVCEVFVSGGPESNPDGDPNYLWPSIVLDW